MRLGFDVGGTSIKLGLVDEQCRITARASAPYPTGAPCTQVARLMYETACTLTHGQTPEYVGVAVPGSIDPTASVVIHAHNLGLHHAPLAEALHAYFPHSSLRLANDADAAALAELQAGAFAGKRRAVLLTLGTGVGGGIILDWRLFTGGRRNGVELGHIVLNRNGEPCTCGLRGCLETCCSATALKREGIRSLQSNPCGGIARAARGKPERVNAKLVLDCARRKDPDALAIFREYIEALSAGIESIWRMLQPETVALGGGVSHAGDFLIQPLAWRLRERLGSNACDVCTAALRNDAGIIGASQLDQ